MTVWAIGLNHNSAPLDVRGRLSFGIDQLGVALQEFRASTQNSIEAAILSTCNRTEIYCAGNQLQLDHTLDWLCQHRQIALPQLQAHTYQLADDGVARHAFRVASGLDSMVLGEPQILGQMKTAVQAASQAGALGTTLNQLFQRSFAVAKEVRSQTDIGTQSISMAAASVRLASQLFESLHNTKVLLIGAGEMIELCATHFGAKNPQQMVIANRTAARGQALAQRLGADTLPLSDVPSHLSKFDIVISCTASTLPIIGLGAIESALKQRKNKPMFMVDLAVPRDIEAEAAHLESVYLYTVDDLAKVVRTGQETRQSAVKEAEIIIDSGVHKFNQWLQQRDHVPLIQELNAQLEDWRSAELAKAKKMIEKGDDIDSVLEALSQRLAKKIMHGPMSELASQDAASRQSAKAAIEQLFFKRY